MRRIVILLATAMVWAVMVASPASASTVTTISDEVSCLTTRGAFAWIAPSTCRIAQHWQTNPDDTLVVDNGVELQMYARNLFWGNLVVKDGSTILVQPNGKLETWAPTAVITIEQGATATNYGSWLQFFGGDTYNYGSFVNGSFLGFFRLGNEGSVFNNYGSYLNDARQFVLRGGEFNNYGTYLNTGSHSNAFLYMAGGDFVNRCGYASYESPGPILGQGSPTVEFPCDEDGDGVVDALDLCPATPPLSSATSDELRKNRFAVDATGAFVDGDGTESGFTIWDTVGCDEHQIIEALSLGKGHTRFGIPRGELEIWLFSNSA